LKSVDRPAVRDTAEAMASSAPVVVDNHRSPYHNQDCPRLRRTVGDSVPHRLHYCWCCQLETGGAGRVDVGVGGDGERAGGGNRTGPPCFGSSPAPSSYLSGPGSVNALIFFLINCVSEEFHD